MATIEIPEELDVVLEGAAYRAGRTKNDLAQDILATHLEEESLPISAFGDEQIARLKRGIEQLDRGEVITAEQVDERFATFFAKLASR